MNKTYKLNCHPKNKSKKSCIPNKVIYKLKKQWNLRHPDKKIISNNINTIRKQLKKYNSICNNELCLLNNIDSSMSKELFAPQSPKEWIIDKNTWLNSLDIINVMKQYEETYPKFKFIGPSPIDFDERKLISCVWPDLCNFDIDEYILNNKTNIGIIFNLDPHYKTGSHWVCMFINLNEKYIFFFDSNGDPIPYQIKKLKDKIIKQCLQKKIRLKYYDNENIEHQSTNTECGMYCLYTILKLLTKDKNVNFFIKKKIPDNIVEAYRSIYFNTFNI